MTIQHVYNLYDSTIETYIAQFMSTHDKLMKRECENLFEQAKQIHLKNPISSQGSLYRYADSYLMIHTADFDDQTGIYTPVNPPVTICNFGVFNNTSESDVMTDDEKTYTKLLDTQTT